MSDYKIGDDVAIRVTVGDVGMGGPDGKYPDRNPVLQIEFAVVGAVYGNSGSRVALADPYIESGIADVDAVLPWPDAERMALLEAVLLAARDDLTYGPPTGTHTREMLAKAVASRGRRLRVGWLQPYPLDTGGSNRGTDPPSACPVRRSSVSSWRESGRVGTW